VAATDAARAAERGARISRGKPFDAFCQAWVTPEPPTSIPYFGSWDDPKLIYASDAGTRVTMDANNLRGALMLNPKDLRIQELEREVAQLRVQLGSVDQRP
jgi:hypothetical protein